MSSIFRLFLSLFFRLRGVFVSNTKQREVEILVLLDGIRQHDDDDDGDTRTGMLQDS
jgi:hypothetical protein